MEFVSTRGRAPSLGFGDVLLTGLANDGGLYVPAAWPQLPEPPAAGSSPRSYADIAIEVMTPFVAGSIDAGAFAGMVEDAYATFLAPDVTPLLDLGGDVHLMELFHGPTLAFKDVALQLVGRLFDHELAARGDRVTIVGATSGDTGSAAIEACRDREAVDIFVLHPHGRVSDVQRKQMTTVTSTNVHNVAIDGTFDDCQDLVKAMFADEGFRNRIRLGAVNSINWARVMAQIVYYVVASERLVGRRSPVSFSVPTGNFGNVFAGWGARSMGLPIDRLIVGSNSNDILTRTLASGRMDMNEVTPTLSPSMDIQISSNFERLLFELYGRNGQAIADLMTQFRAEGSVTLGDAYVESLGEVWHGYRVDDDGEGGTRHIIKQVFDTTGIVVDPHTAVGIGAAWQAGPGAGPTVCLGTAHPAKFPDAVESAIGDRPALPDRVADLFERKEHMDRLPNNLAAVQAFVEGKARITAG